MKGRIAMKYGLGSLLLAGGLVLSFGVAYADVLMLTSSAIPDNGALAIKNACSDKQRSPNCVGENMSPPLAWSGVPEGTKSFALLLFDPEGRAPAGVSHMVVYGIPASVTGFAEGELSQPSDKFVGGKSTMEKAVYFGPGTPPNTDWHHYTWALVATDLDPKALQHTGKIAFRRNVADASARHVDGICPIPIVRRRHRDRGKRVGSGLTGID
jgi:Raf kinase inhibitor-like YbhB/YbcL family protein